MRKDYGLNTIAALKRCLYLGQKWHTYHHVLKRDMGVRAVAEIKSGQVGFRTERGTSWLQFPKAKDFKGHEDERGFDIYEEGELVLTYRMEDT